MSQPDGCESLEQSAIGSGLKVTLVADNSPVALLSVVGGGKEGGGGSDGAAVMAKRHRASLACASGDAIVTVPES